MSVNSIQTVWFDQWSICADFAGWSLLSVVRAIEVIDSNRG